MATKWRRFRHSRALKIVLFLVIVGCMSAIAGMAAYIFTYDYERVYLPECLSVSDYLQTNRHYNEVCNAFDFVQSDIREMLEANPDYNFEDGKTLFRNTDTDFGYSVTIKNVENNISVIVTNTSGMEKYGFFYAVNEDGTVQSSDSINPTEFVSSPYITSIKIGFDNGYITAQQNNWYIAHENTIDMLVGGGICFISALIAFILLALIVGKNGEGVVCKPHLIYRIFSEIQIGVLVAATYYFFVIFREIDMANGISPVLLTAFFCGVSVIYMTYVLYVACGAVINLRNHRFLKNFLSVLILLFLWKWLKRAAAAVKRVLTGEAFYGTGIVKCHTYRQITMCVVTILIFIIGFFASISWSGWWYPTILLEIISLIVYFVGSWKMITYEAKLSQQINNLSEGKYSVPADINEKSPYFEDSQKLCKISGGYIASLNERVKAERMKIELVTNVSHDLKTPLTSIISYVELLSKEELSPEAADYVKILQKKSERLKNIVSDVFELAKTTSGEIKIDTERIDIGKLVVQTLADMDDRIKQSGLHVRTKLTAENTHIISDGKRMYRVLQNVMDNALKYSLAGTRIYVELAAVNGIAVLEIKNTAGYEMTFTKEEILERFTRGDKSRTTEGSGLGLSIAQGFTLACGGSFDIAIDGDMFKVIIKFPISIAKPQPIPQKETVNI